VTSDPDSFDDLLREAAALRVPATDLARLPAPGELLEGKYRIERKLGKGGMGAVFHATNIETGKPVALKWLLAPSSNLKACARFTREAQVAARIDHPNVVNVFDVGTHQGGHFLVMELLHGQSLGARIQTGRLSARELVEIMIPVLRGVVAAHAAGVIHRDLKPDNVFLCVGPDGAARGPKVLDFGVSKFCSHADPRASTLRSDPPLEERLTGQGTGLGTLAYMSPEQLVDAVNVDERTDVYAAGAMMYEALSGRLPFRAENYNALVLAIAAQRPLPLSAHVPNVPKALERIVMQALAKEAAARQPDAQALIGALEAWLRESDSRSERARLKDEAREAATPSPRRRRLAWLLAAGAVFPVLLTLWLRHVPSTPLLSRDSAAPSTGPRHSQSTPALAVRNVPVAGVIASREAAPVPSARAQGESVPAEASTKIGRSATVAPSGSRPRERSRAGAIRISDL
jgi:serine/threonine protein kinase